jgi:hypothetical protein
LSAEPAALPAALPEAGITLAGPHRALRWVPVV